MEFSPLDDVAEDDIIYHLTDSISDDQLPGEIYNLSHDSSSKLRSNCHSSFQCSTNSLFLGYNILKKLISVSNCMTRGTVSNINKNKIFTNCN